MKLRVMSVSLAIMGALSCGSEEPPVPGSITLELETPNNDDGAILFNVRGPGISNVRSTTSSNRVFSRLISDDEVKVIVVGNLAEGPVVTLDVPDVNDLTPYSTFVEQVADRTDDLRESLEGYGISLPVTEISGGVTAPTP